MLGWTGREALSYLPWPPEEPWPPEAAPAEEDPVEPEFEEAAGEAETLEALDDIAPEYPAEVCDIPEYAPALFVPPNPPPPLL